MPEPMRLRGIDLNLLPVLRQVLADRSVTLAAKALGMSQPAVSKALGRLRHKFGDPLLIRSGRGMILTPRAQRLLPVVDAECRRLESLWASEDFDLATTRRKFTIAATDYEAMIVLPEISADFSEQAPSASLAFRTIWAEPDTDWLSKIDLVVGPQEALEAVLEADQHMRVLLRRERFVTVAADGQIQPSRQMTFTPGWTAPSTTKLLHAYLPADCFATLPNFTVLPILALLTGSSAVVPQTIAERFCDHLPLTILNEPASPAEITILMAWHARWDADEGHRWLRNLIVSRCQQA